MAKIEQFSTEKLLKQLTWKEDLVLSTIVLQAAWGLPSGRLRSIEQEWGVTINRRTHIFAHVLVETKHTFHFNIYI